MSKNEKCFPEWTQKIQHFQYGSLSYFGNLYYLDLPI